MLKSTLSVLQLCHWQYGSIFIHLAVVGAQICEIPQNSERIWTYSRSRSSKVIDLGVNWKRMCAFLLVINSNFGCIFYRFRDIDVKARKWLVFPTPPLFGAPLMGNMLEFLEKTYPAKTTGMGLPYGENFIILTSTVFLWSTRVMQRDGRTGDNI